ncbi:hypothetical protein EXW51_29160 (plasmid) [Bacillus mycoides]|uniref:hypothetical protein n=1 Tax=Bacillus mycoides TaxID=1405 RepID=UPI001C0120EB|nr:hypothetical protein [Bacillus mycoides]QWH31946.1 hypothetical protein EXW51_29160 [Bacillus mycoides]
MLTADLPEVEQQIEEAIADADYLLLQELPALYDELTDDIIKEAISELLAAEDEQLNATCELDNLDKATMDILDKVCGISSFILAIYILLKESKEEKNKRPQRKGSSRPSRKPKRRKRK